MRLRRGGIHSRTPNMDHLQIKQEKDDCENIAKLALDKVSRLFALMQGA